MYTLLACADLFGEKLNLELTFAAMPTIGELTRKIEDTYRAEGEVKRPVNFPREYEFRVARLQIYDDVLLKWVDLVTATQLHEYDQLYAFQPQSPWHIDVQKDLPPPRPPTGQIRGGGAHQAMSSYPNPMEQGGSYQQYNQQGPPTYQPGYSQSYPMQNQQPPMGGGYGAPQYGPGPGGFAQASQSSMPNYNQMPPQQMMGGGPMGGPMQMPNSASMNGPNPNVTEDEKVRTVFNEFDTDHDGYISDQELRDGFHLRGIDFTEATVGSLYFRTEPNRGYLSLAEFQKFANRFPNTLDSLYFRCNSVIEKSQGLLEMDERLRTQKSREAELLRELERIRTDSQSLEQQRQLESEKARRLEEQRRLVDDQERQLLQKEYQLQRQRDALRQSEQEFMQSARNFDEHAAQTGSPRRARMYQS